MVLGVIHVFRFRNDKAFPIHMSEIVVRAVLRLSNHAEWKESMHKRGEIFQHNKHGQQWSYPGKCCPGHPVRLY